MYYNVHVVKWNFYTELEDIFTEKGSVQSYRYWLKSVFLHSGNILRKCGENCPLLDNH